jgi:hypothetical protein
MNGIHEVTGSIPVWSTNLRSLQSCGSFGWQANLLAKVVHHSCEAAKVDPKPLFASAESAFFLLPSYRWNCAPSPLM